MSSAIEGLRPKGLWGHFEKLSEIPRPSKHEEVVLDYLKNMFTEKGLEWKQDKAGNIIVRKNGTNGGEESSPLVIQSHVDMVCEKNREKEHDFMKEGITLVRDGKYLTADGTTLGADNGIGVAVMLALLDMPNEIKMPPLECLFTVDEETGLNGAFDLDGSLINGKRMLNLDTEEWGCIYVGCAGGGDTLMNLPINYIEVPSDFLKFEISVEGLQGGHSGVNINEDRGNAIVFLAQILDKLTDGVTTSLVSIKGGDKQNAIPREAQAIVYIDPSEVATAQIIIDKRKKALADEFGVREPNLIVKFSPMDRVLRISRQAFLSDSKTKGVDNIGDLVFDEQSQRSLINLLRILPHGVLKYSHSIPDLVETSNNLARIKRIENEYEILCSSRSSIAGAIEAIRERIAIMGKTCGATCSQADYYPGWKPDLNSSLLKTTKEVYEKCLGKEPEVAAIHAGLECGVIGEKVDGMEMVSIGPTITGAHSPDERVEIESVSLFWDMLIELLSELAETG